MLSPIVHTLDLYFQEQPGTIAAYLLPHERGAALIETGPGSTIPNLVHELSKYGYLPSEITDVFLTHIHLDHAGASGWLSRQGATIHVHPNGYPHLLNPDKLLSSAARIYGPQLDTLWGEFLPVLPDRLIQMAEGEIVTCAELKVKAMYTPGHAYHHNAYLVGDVCFCGDIAGTRLHELRYLTIPMPPPEFHLETWQETIQRLRSENPTYLALTHFGIYADANWHLHEVARILDQSDRWMQQVFPEALPIEQLRQKYLEFEEKRGQDAGLDKKDALAMQLANPSFMSADGMLRYWNKYRIKN